MDAKAIFFVMISLLIGCNDDMISKEKVILTQWGKDTDTILYIDTREKIGRFHEFWKFDSGQSVSLACGYTYEIYASRNNALASWIASANKMCSTVVDDKYTYFKRYNEIIELEKIADTGISKHEKFQDTIAASKFHAENLKNANYIGMLLIESTIQYQVKTSNNKKTLDGRPYRISEYKFDYSRNWQLKECNDADSLEQLCGRINKEELAYYKSKGMQFNSEIEDGIIAMSFWKLP